MSLDAFHSESFKQFVLDHAQDDPALLLLKYQGKVDFDLKEAAQQISARQKASKKLPEWTDNPNLIFPASISLEQSSSQQTAAFKAKNAKGNRMIDLTGGFGVDAFYLSQGFEKAVYCERNPELAQVAAHNLKILAPGKFEIHAGNGLQYLQKTKADFDLIYADPARRGSGNQKLYKLEDCEPNVVEHWNLMKNKASQILLKVSPMLDITQALRELPEIQKVSIISVKNEVKELLLHWSASEEKTEMQIESIDLGREMASFIFSPREEASSQLQIGEVDRFLFEPLAGILKAGAFKVFASRYGLQKLDTNSHLYTSDNLPEAIAARVFEVIQEVGPTKKMIKAIFPSGKVNVLTRNYAMGAEALKKKLGLKDGGSDFLIGTKTTGGFKLFWCKPI